MSDSSLIIDGKTLLSDSLQISLFNHVALFYKHYILHICGKMAAMFPVA